MWPPQAQKSGTITVAMTEEKATFIDRTKGDVFLMLRTRLYLFFYP